MTTARRAPGPDEPEHPHTILPLVAAIVVVALVFAAFFLVRAVAGPATPAPSPSVTSTATARSQ